MIYFLDFMSRLDASDVKRNRGESVVDNALVEYAKARGFDEDAPQR